ncbi:GAF domain-containing protein [Blastococcus sp. CT_GayMR20]|uniref:GAF domain-containing protein n=1 Tax=Blastococcus sp. CT_GayMR20 TaxID=2559609 RepID=UPI001430B7B7|nr:GAF domain-containing protein [Blastococcus sp. CT_GayMR20]
MSDARARLGATQRLSPPASPFDARAAVEHLLARLRASAGATRVSVWVHEATTGTVVPFRQAVAESAVPLVEDSRLHRPLALQETPFFSRVIGSRSSTVAQASGRRAADREVESLGIRSAHAEPLIVDGEVIGVLTVEPAAAAAPHLLRQVTPKLAVAVAEAWARRSEKRRAAQAAVLLGLIESASKAPSMDHLLAAACRRLAELGEVERACIFLLEDGRLVPGVAADRLPVTETVLRTGLPLTPDGDPGLLAIPLGRNPHLTGVLTLDSVAARPFPEDVRRLAAAAGAHLGGVLAQGQPLARAGQAAVPLPRSEAAAVELPA